MKKSNFSTQDISLVALGTVITVISSWISIPTPVPFTMQSFGIIFLCLVLGTRRTFFSLLIYFLLGAVGIPVFAGFRSGISAISGPTGGYIVGFFLFPFVIRPSYSRKHFNYFTSAIAMVMLYAFGTLWYSCLYVKNPSGILSGLSVCVIPYIIPDVIKCVFAIFCAKKINNRLHFC